MQSNDLDLDLNLNLNLDEDEDKDKGKQKLDRGRSLILGYIIMSHAGLLESPHPPSEVKVNFRRVIIMWGSGSARQMEVNPCTVVPLLSKIHHTLGSRISCIIRRTVYLIICHISQQSNT